jgi:hypothetical protein
MNRAPNGMSEYSTRGGTSGKLGLLEDPEALKLPQSLVQHLGREPAHRVLHGAGTVDALAHEREDP